MDPMKAMIGGHAPSPLSALVWVDECTFRLAHRMLKAAITMGETIPEPNTLFCQRLKKESQPCYSKEACIAD